MPFILIAKRGYGGGEFDSGGEKTAVVHPLLTSIPPLRVRKQVDEDGDRGRTRGRKARGTIVPFVLIAGERQRRAT